MLFVDPAQAQARARSVKDLLPASAGARLLSKGNHVYLVAPDGAAVVFGALTGKISFRDTDGEFRWFQLPDGITSESVAAMLFGLASAKEWS